MKNLQNTLGSGRGGLRWLFSILVLCCLSSTIGLRGQAQSPPEKLSYQGYLSDLSVDPAVGLEDEHNIQLWIFAAESGGVDSDALWAEQFTDVSFSSGVFSVILGDAQSVDPSTYPGPTSTETVGNSLADVFTEITSSAPDRFLQIRVQNTAGTYEVIDTRLRFLTSPFAFYATQAANAATADSATTAESLVSDKLIYSSSNSKFDLTGGLDVSGTATLGQATVNGTASFAGTVTTEKVEVQATEEVDTSGNGALIVGDTSNTWLAIDGTTIQANNATQWAASNPSFEMSINPNGGRLKVGGPLTLGEDESSGHSALSTSRSGQPRTHNQQLIFQTTEGSEWLIGMERGTTTTDDDELFFTYHNGGEVAGQSYEPTIYLEPLSGWTTGSDRRIKKDIEPIESGVLERVMEMPPVRYRLKQAAEDSTKAYGFIAQDVQKVFPDLVDSDNEHLALPYSRFGVLAVAAIRELKAESDEHVGELSDRIESLQSENAQLKDERKELANQLDRVMERLAALEARIQ